MGNERQSEMVRDSTNPPRLSIAGRPRRALFREVLGGLAVTAWMLTAAFAQQDTVILSESGGAYGSEFRVAQPAPVAGAVPVEGQPPGQDPNQAKGPENQENKEGEKKEEEKPKEGEGGAGGAVTRPTDPGFKVDPAELEVFRPRAG